MHKTPSNIRRLWRYDRPALVAHFTRLDHRSRRLRFGATLNDRMVADYASHILAIDTLIFGAFSAGTLHGVGELRARMGHWPPTAELALSVEPDWQSSGIGDALMTRLVAAAQNRGVRRLVMLCLRENAPMVKLARRNAAFLDFEDGDIEAVLTPPWPTPMSWAEEMVGETNSYLRAVFQISG